MSSTKVTREGANPTQTGTPVNLAPGQPAVPRAGVPGLWLCIVGGLLFWLFSLAQWVQTDTQSAGYGGLQFTDNRGITGSSYFPLGGLGEFLVFAGLAAWLATTHKKIAVSPAGVPLMPAWVPLAVAAYGLYAVVHAGLDRASLARSNFTGGYGGHSTTGLTIPLLLAIVCLGLFAFGAVRYWRSNSPGARGGPGPTR